MCRIFCAHAPEPFALAPQIEAFAHIAEHSREYQGHGWGYSAWSGTGWTHYHDIRPIWDDPTPHAGHSNLLLIHARSAFRDEGIAVENNMPFYDHDNVFIFNGELRGVRIKAEGRIGAEKIFNFVKRFERHGMSAALAKGTNIISKRSRYVRAMNIIMASPDGIHVASSFAEDPGYFQLRVNQQDDRLTICSDPLSGRGQWDAGEWREFPNHHNESFTRW
ncbi:MAG: hypothetical protein AAF458_08315 [Pseudomonadota bacterium]